MRLMMVVMQAGPWDAVIERFRGQAGDVRQAASELLVALAILAVGWVVAMLAGRITRAALRAARFDDAVRGLVGGHALAHQPAHVGAWLVRWSILALAAGLALESIGIDVLGHVADRLGDVVPRIVVAALLFAVGGLLAMLAAAITRRFLESAGVRGARWRAQLVGSVLTGFAALVALEQLGFAAQFVMLLAIVAIGAVALALGLAFGLGCRDLARDFVVEYLRSLDEPERDRTT